MPKKLIVRVRPGVALTCATLAPRRELIRLDLPTLERPRKAISGGPAAGNCSTAVADLMNFVATFTHIHLTRPMLSFRRSCHERTLSSVREQRRRNLLRIGRSRSRSLGSCSQAGEKRLL